MQALQDSLQPVKNSIISDTLIFQSKTTVDSSASFFLQPGRNQTFINLYHEHELKPKYTNDQSINYEKPDWFFLLFLVVIAVLAYLRVAYGKYLSLIGKAFLNNNITTQIVRDENLLVQRASIMLSVVFYLSASLLVYIISVHYHWPMGGISTGFIRYSLIAMLIASVYFLKYLILKISGSLFDFNRETTVYIFNVFIINNVLGIALIPILAIIVFFGQVSIGWLLAIAVIFVASAYIYRLVRGIIIGISVSSRSPAYLFLYLCTLEIAPLFLLIKIISQQ